MGFRFYRRVRILPGVSVNFSRSGPSLSVGLRGPHRSRVYCIHCNKRPCTYRRTALMRLESRLRFAVGPVLSIE